MKYVKKIMKAVIETDVTNKLDNYARILLCEDESNIYQVMKKRAHQKINNIYNAVIKDLCNPRSLCRPSPYWYFGGQEKHYRYFTCHDDKSKRTVWAFSYEVDDNDNFYIHDMALAKNLASFDKLTINVEKSNKMKNENISYIPLDELSEFHSWMKRLDEVKGARPTFWC